MDTMDNSKLEELMSQELTVEIQNQLFEVLKDSQLLLPVTFSEDVYENIENAKEGDVFQTGEHTGFNINYLTDEDGNNAIPLFTSPGILESTGLKSSVMGIFMSDLAEMLKQTDKYSIITINPFTPYDINMPVSAFINLFRDDDEILESMKGILKILKEKSIELEDDYVFYLRSDHDFMSEEAEDGVFVPNIPFNISTRRDFHCELKYLNIILMPEKTRILYFGGVVDDNHFDTVIAPGSELHHVEDIDEFTRVWKCGAQPFYE